MESRAFHICPFCRAPSAVSEQRCKGCGRSLVGLPLAVYGSEIDAALAHPSPKPLMDRPLRAREPTNEGLRPAPAPLPRASAARRKPGPPALRRPPREPLPGAIVGMAAALAAAIGAGATLVRPRRPAPAVPTPAAREVPSRRAATQMAGAREPAALPAPVPIAVRATAPPLVVTEPDEDALVLRAQLRHAEESRDRLADRVDLLRARMNVPAVTDVDHYQRLQDQLETAREDLDRAEADVARWRRALKRVG